MLGLVAALYDYDCTEAGRRFQLATACEPVSAQVRYYYGFYYLFTVGRYKEAVERQEQARKEDPLNLLAACSSCQAFERPEGTRTHSVSYIKCGSSMRISGPCLFCWALSTRPKETLRKRRPVPSNYSPCVIVFPRVLRLLEWRTTHEIDPAFQEGQRE